MRLSCIAFSKIECVSRGLFCQNQASLSFFDPFKIKSVSLVGDFDFYSILAILFCWFCSSGPTSTFHFILFFSDLVLWSCKIPYLLLSFFLLLIKFSFIKLHLRANHWLVRQVLAHIWLTSDGRNLVTSVYLVWPEICVFIYSEHTIWLGLLSCICQIALSFPFLFFPGILQYVLCL